MNLEQRKADLLRQLKEVEAEIEKSKTPVPHPGDVVECISASMMQPTTRVYTSPVLGGYRTSGGSVFDNATPHPDYIHLHPVGDDPIIQLADGEVYLVIDKTGYKWFTEEELLRESKKGIHRYGIIRKGALPC